MRWQATLDLGKTGMKCVLRGDGLQCRLHPACSFASCDHAAATHCPAAAPAARYVTEPPTPLLRAQVSVQASNGHFVYQFEPACSLGVKLAGVHWWFKSRSHAAELTAGYYNTRDRDGYLPVMLMLKKHDSRLSFTCVEMRDCEHPPEGRCSPQGLLQQVIECAEHHGVPLAGENALQRYDSYAFDRIAESAFGRSARAGRLEQLTFLRMGDLMFDNWDAFSSFLRRMRSMPH
jgi:beta-amylase